MMVYDYVRGHWGEAPLAYASSYYARYPKVALGHWPPLFYTVQTVWYGIVGEGIAQAHFLNLSIALALAGLGFESLRRYFGAAATLMAIAFLMSAPVAVAASVLVLSDGLVCLLCWLCCLLWWRALDSGRARDWCWLSVCLAAAILTKGNAWVLLGAVPLATWMAGESAALRRPGLWLSLGGAAALATPFYWWAQVLSTGYPISGVARSAEWEVLLGRLGLLRHFLYTLPWTFWPLAIAGAYLGSRKPQGPVRRLWSYSAALTLALLGFLGVTGLSYEDRVFLPLFPALAIYLLMTMEALRARSRWTLAMVGVFLLAIRPEAHYRTVEAFAAVAGAIPLRPGGVSVLIASDSLGEGSLVAQRLVLDEQREGVVLRASKLLSEQGWGGQGFRETVRSDAALSTLLEETPVHFVVIDSACVRPYAQRLRRLAEAERWILLERRTRSGRSVEVYEHPRTQAKRIEKIQFNLGPWHGGRAVAFEAVR